MRSFKHTLLVLCCCFLAIQIQAQVNHPTSGTANQTVTCGTPLNYFDSGGAGGNYSSGETGTIVFCPDVAGQAITLTYSAVDIETSTTGSGTDGCWDFVTISDANGVLVPVGCGEPDQSPIGAATDIQPGSTFTSTGADGCLTVTFTSDGSITDIGWEATVSCDAVAPPSGCTSLYDQPSNAPVLLNGYSILGGPDRSVMDDFGIPAGSGWVIEEVSIVFARSFNPFNMPDIDIEFRDDALGTPGATFSTQTIPAGTIVDNGSVASAFGFDWHAVTIPLLVPVSLAANNSYWLEIGTPSGDNYFVETINNGGPVIGSESWVDYPDGVGFAPGSVQFGTPADHSFNLCGSLANGPTAVCANATVILSATDPGMATLTPAMIDGGSTNDAANCGPLTLSIIGQTDYTCADVGLGNQVTVTLVATDNCGSTTCDATVTTEDQTPPTPTCQPFTAELDQNGVATVGLADVLASATDNCGVLPGGQVTQDAFNCAELGANTVTVTVTDVNGLSGNCDATVTVEDNIDPVAVCQDITIQLDAAGAGGITAADIDGGTSDNCSFVLSVTPAAFDCTNVGTNVVILTATDPSNNTHDCTATVTVEDNVAPVANCQNIAIQLDANGEVSIAPVDVDGGSTDACGPLVFAVNQEDFDCENIGPNTVTLTVTDANGNSSTCEATVTVQDNIPAIILCRPSVNTVNDPGVCGADVLLLPPLVIEENCSIMDVDRMPAPGTIFDIGTTLVTWTLTDAGGNATSCLQNVTINDTEAPVVECGQPFHAYLAEVDNDPPLNWNNCFFPSYLLDPIQFISDNCGAMNLTITNDAPTNFPPGFYSVNYTFTDESGNVGTCVQSVKVWDITAPTLTSCPDDIEVEATTTDGANVSWAEPTATDNCPSHDIILVEANGYESGDFFELGETEIQYNVYDENGQFTECNFTVTVVPVGGLSMSLACLDDLNISQQNDMGWAALGWNPPLITNNCEQCDVLASDDFRFIGSLSGHQYYGHSADEMTLAQAIAYAENIGAEIAVLEDKKEVPMIANELPEGNYFIGLVDAEGTNEFEWLNGDEFVQADFGQAFENLSEEPAAVILNEEGEWEVVLIEDATANFVFEKVCVDLDVEIDEGDEDETPELGEVGNVAAVTYTAVDQCGNVATCGFEIALVTETVAYCEPTGIATDEENPFFIESFTINGYTVESGDDNGYGDHTDENFLFEAGETLDIATSFAGPNIEELPMYCRIWMDLNNDGDFFDEGELVMQGVDVEEALNELTVPNVAQNVENSVMRVAISRLTYAESCGDFLNGEVEDYTFSIVQPEESQTGDDDFTFGENNGLGADMFLYPNPAQDELFVKLKNVDAETATLRIFNTVGQLVASEKVDTKGAIRLDVSAYTNGLYSLTAEADGAVRLTQKFVIEQR